MMPRIDNATAIVAMMDRIVNCGDLVDLAEAEVAAALKMLHKSQINQENAGSTET